MNDKTQHAVACSGFLVAVYMIYCGGTVLSGGQMPDGMLFGGLIAAVGIVFGFKFGAMHAEGKLAEKKALDSEE